MSRKEEFDKRTAFLEKRLQEFDKRAAFLEKRLQCCCVAGLHLIPQITPELRAVIRSVIEKLLAAFEEATRAGRLIEAAYAQANEALQPFVGETCFEDDNEPLSMIETPADVVLYMIGGPTWPQGFSRFDTEMLNSQFDSLPLLLDHPERVLTKVGAEVLMTVPDLDQAAEALAVQPGSILTTLKAEVDTIKGDAEATIARALGVAA